MDLTRVDRLPRLGANGDRRQEPRAQPKGVKSVGGVPNCTGSAVCFSRLWVRKKPKLRLRSAQLSESQGSRSRFPSLANPSLCQTPPALRWPPTCCAIRRSAPCDTESRKTSGFVLLQANSPFALRAAPPAMRQPDRSENYPLDNSNRREV